MKKPDVPDQLYRTLFPRPRSNDPATFNQYISRVLVPEVRTEVQTFYGALDSIEAQYPGLDYTWPPHRQRLSRFPAHKRLFRVFEELGLTDNEILAICVWEGTKCAKDKYERDHNRRIRDTTADGVEVALRVGGPVAVQPKRKERADGRGRRRAQKQVHWGSRRGGQLDDLVSGTDDEQTDEDEDEYDYSIGVQLNQQLRAAADARARGEPAVFDAQWEQWMKEAMERNDMSMENMMDAIRDGLPFPGIMLSRDTGPAARTTATEPIPVPAPATASRPSTAIPPPTHSIGDLQAALRELQSTNARLEADNRALERVISEAQTETARAA